MCALLHLQDTLLLLRSSVAVPRPSLPSVTTSGKTSRNVAMQLLPVTSAICNVTTSSAVPTSPRSSVAWHRRLHNALPCNSNKLLGLAEPSLCTAAIRCQRRERELTICRTSSRARHSWRPLGGCRWSGAPGRSPIQAQEVAILPMPHCHHGAWREHFSSEKRILAAFR